MSRRTSRIVPAVMAAALLLGAPLLAACGNAVEGIAEQAAEAAGAENVDIDENGVTIEDSAGNNIAIGDDIALPDTWPAAIPAPDGGKLNSVMVSADGATANAMWMVEGTAEDALAAYDAQLTSAGFTKGTDMAAAGMTGGDYTGNGFKVNVLSLSADDNTTLMVNAEPES